MKRILLLPCLLIMAAVTWAQGPNSSGSYYQAADGKKGAALKTALCGIIYNRNEGGSLDKAYKALWTHFQTTDKRDDGCVWDMYSGISNYTFGSPYQDNGSGGSEEWITTGPEKDGKYNREHSFPNSWFGGKVMPMYTDLHHMYPTDKLVNNKRSNYPFGETDGANYGTTKGYKSANSFSKLGANTYPGYSGMVFEPNDIYKGDFARTYFYMVTCYEEKLPDWYDKYSDSRPILDGSTYPGFQTWQLKMLMEWADKDPVSEKEINRNNAVYDIQENRNPFIDYPGLEEYVWGSMTDVAFSYDHYVRPEDYSGIIKGVVSFDETKPNTIIYDLQGRKVGTTVNGTPHLKKGVYIMSGRKVIAN